jgi:hypothetical protein
MKVWKKVWLKILVIVVLVGALAAAGYFYYRYQIVSGNAADKETKRVVAMIGRIMILPDEMPTLATVTDATKLNSQRFFKNAQNGDKVLIYSLTSKAILYRPGINKIVEVASVQPVDTAVPSSANAQLTQTSIQEVSGQMQLALDNGTQTIGLTTKLAKTITDKFPDVSIKSKESAARNDYQQTIIVDITGKYKQRISDLAEFLGAKIVALPQGESRPDADAVVIFGKSSVQ